MPSRRVDPAGGGGGSDLQDTPAGAPCRSGPGPQGRPAAVAHEPGRAHGYVTLFENSASFNGGGLHAAAGADVLWRSDPPGAFGGRAVGNQAGTRGGTIHLGGASRFHGTWIRIESSRAADRGGAIAAVGAGTTLTLARGPALRCSGSGGSSACPGIVGTRGIAQGGAVVRLEQQHTYGTWARNGSAVHAADADIQVTLENALVARTILYALGNPNATIESTNGARVVLAQARMAGDFRASLAFPGVEPALSSIRTSGATSAVAVRNSLLWNDAAMLMRRLLGADVSGAAGRCAAPTGRQRARRRRSPTPGRPVPRPPTTVAGSSSACVTCCRREQTSSEDAPVRARPAAAEPSPFGRGCWRIAWRAAPRREVAMNQTLQPPEADERPFVAPCRSLSAGAPLRWLRLGWADLRAAPAPTAVFGALVLALSLLVSGLAWWLGRFALLATVLSGFVFVAPLLGVGLYAVSRARAEGRPPSVGDSLALARRVVGQAAVFALMQLVIVMVWSRAGMMVSAIVPMAPGRSAALVEFLLVGSAVGSVFAAITFAAAAFSLPMIADRDVDMVTACLSSVHAVLRNPAAMAVWAALIVLLTAIGFATAFLGLALILPWLAYASWHGYRETIDASAWPRLPWRL